ncbi:hypothetical protein BKA58DRAFT_391248 [Alternaria rosae]|uniref:uncharacterized protein n=1 Tax=Alternaria rosae TaxID=1187941 RepID=UPI001E8DFFBA|nr:uncharacterized protein BKA58DRAFT_391248 [Alternaria rosae]KAH6865032.1 hypothetical protein BKA58DRAFT_391248 [Alternaria rosae]
MCKYTITILECGHKQDDHADTYNCPYFERTTVPCDRDNPRTKDRCIVKTRDQNGICNRCLRDNEEAAIRRDEEREREFKRRENEEAAEALRRGERELLEKNRRQAEERRRAQQQAEEEARDRSRREADQKQRAEEEAREKSRREAEQRRRAEQRAEEEATEKRRREAERKRRAERKAEEEAMEKRRREAEQRRRDEEEAMERDRREAEERRRRAEKEAEEEAIARKRREHERKMAEEEQALLKSRRDHEKKMAEEREAFEKSRREYEKRMADEQLERDMQLMIQKTKEEEERKKREEEEALQRALRESAKWEQERKYQEDLLRSRTAAPPSPPATPPAPPAPAPKPAVSKSAPRPPPAPKPTPKEINYSLPAVGDQKIGRFTMGGRRVPIHESQDIPDTPTTSGIPMSPTSPAPFARLGGAIAASDVPVVREVRGQVPPVKPAAMDSRAGLRRTSETRKAPPPVPERIGVDPKLQALLEKRRAWEAEEEEKKDVSPPRSPSGQEPTARRLSPSEFDTKRKTGWKKEEA